MLEHQDGRNADADACAALRTLWEIGRPASIRIRLDLIIRRGPGWDNPSPLQEVATSRGIGVQMLLLLLFEAQCRPVGRFTRRPPGQPLRNTTDPKRPAWARMVSTPVSDETDTRSVAGSALDNRVGQIKSALDRLSAKGRIELGSTGKGRFERFRVLHETADNRGAAPTAYRIPRRGENVIAVPVEFFLNGWIHTLNDNEIITYLLFLWSWQNAAPQDRTDGLLMPRQQWRLAFGSKGRGHESYRFLTRCGVIGYVVDDRRRPNGTIRSHNDDETHTSTRTDPHRFFLQEEALNRHALPITAQALTGVAEGIDIDDAFGLSHGLVAPSEVRPAPWRQELADNGI
jgi:hypothetical protein